MLKSIFKSALPHIIAVAIFAIVAIIYCKPALEGKVLQQSDITQWKGMAQDAFAFKERNGNFPLWSNSMFGGMPAYQTTGVGGFEYSVGWIDQLLTLRLAEPISLFFLASLCFYFLAQVLGFNTIISIIGALGYSYATYNPIIVTVGHITKMHSIAYLPLFIGSLLVLYQKKYLLGGILTSIATVLLIQGNHIQIDYYGVLIAIIMSVYFLIIWIKNKEYTHILKTLGIGLTAGIIGITINAPILLSTYEYGKESIRGGSKLITKDSKTTSTGLNKDYALSYSMYKSEPLVLMFPNIYGGASDPNAVDPANSKAIETLQQMQPQVAQQLQSFLSFYWGGIGFTAGPPYVGVIICFFALLGFSVKDNKHKWWIAATIILSFLLSAGSYLESFNVFILNNIPFYNKFRAPSMIMVIPTLLLGIMALYGMAEIATETSLKNITKKYKLSFILTGIILLSVLYIYFTSDFKSDGERNLIEQVAKIPDANQRAVFETPARDLVNAIATDRKGMIEGDVVKFFIYVLLIFTLVFLAIKKVINQTVLLVAFGILSMIDLFQVNLKYLKSDSFIEAAENENAFALSPIDIALKKDTTQYRVLDMRAGINNAFNGGAIVAYNHKTVGGYHAAKLSIYQDLIENQWYKFPNCMPTVNMLNTKYVISGNIANDTIPNKDALGNVWFVKGIQVEKGPAEVMKRLDSFNPKDTAVIEEKDKIESLNNLEYDENASIALVNNKNDEINYTSSSTKKQLAVFSEIYYNLGWKAYIDNVETPIVKTNYVLRGLVVPAGNHAIRFEFKPITIKNSIIASTFASILLWICIATMIVIAFRNKQKSI
ncbi:MAG: YfhO family protein [Chitinophagaceae bacterium]|nr:YfhO family protein [Chitinophagaceae bacterium]